MECISKGEIVIGDEVVLATYDYYSIDNKSISFMPITVVNISARKIPL